MAYPEYVVSPSQQAPVQPSPVKITETTEKEKEQPILQKQELSSPTGPVSESSKVNKRIRIYWPNVWVHHVLETKDDEWYTGTVRSQQAEKLEVL